MKAADFWYGRINKHTEDATREDVFNLMEAYAKERERKAVRGLKKFCEDNYCMVIPLRIVDEFEKELDIKQLPTTP